jgi:hypothetical protein
VQRGSIVELTGWTAAGTTTTDGDWTQEILEQALETGATS